MSLRSSRPRIPASVALAAAGAALSLACAPVSPSDEEARVSVEVFSGFTQPGVPVEDAVPRTERVEVLVDVTTSMAAPTGVGPPRHAASRGAAARLIRALPGDRAIGLHAVGFAQVEGCQPAFRVGQSEPGTARDALLRELDALEPAGEGSIALALDGLRVFLALTEHLDGSRIVVLSDLGDECGGDLCATVADVVAGGGRVDFVLFGGREAPACLEEVEPAWRSAAPPPPAFRVVADEGGATLATGRADGAPRAAPPGLVWLEVDLVPPLRAGPVRLATGATTRLRVLDFPALDPPVREWAWETDGGHPAAAGATHASGSGAAP